MLAAIAQTTDRSMSPGKILFLWAEKWQQFKKAAPYLVKTDRQQKLLLSPKSGRHKTIEGGDHFTKVLSLGVLMN